MLLRRESIMRYGPRGVSDAVSLWGENVLATCRTVIPVPRLLPLLKASILSKGMKAEVEARTTEPILVTLSFW